MSVKITFNDKVYLPVDEEALVAKKCVIFKHFREIATCGDSLRTRYLEAISGILGKDCKPTFHDVSAKIASKQDMHAVRMIEAILNHA